MIEIHDLHKYFGSLHVLKGIDLNVEKGEVLSVIGASGSGKSTLLYCINGLEPVQQGTVVVDGTDVHAKGTDINRLRQQLGMVFQQWNSFPHMTVLENVALAPQVVKKISKSEAIEIAKKELEHVGLGDKFDVYPTKMSGGQQQRVGIARALAQEPAVMLADEPVAALDPVTSRQVMGDLQRINREMGITTLVNLHFLDLAREFGSRLVGLRDGEVVFDGDISDVTDVTFQEIYGRAITDDDLLAVDAEPAG